MRFDRDQFVADCQAAARSDSTHAPVREVVARAVAEPSAVLAGLGEPQRAGIETLYRAPDLTILNVIWGARMTLMPHDHRVWALIGIYTGREDNIFWRRLPAEDDGRTDAPPRSAGAAPRIEAAGARALSVKETLPLGREIIHSVTNPIPRLTGAIHVYGGDFFGIDRSQWDPETLREERWDIGQALQTFEDANRLSELASRGSAPSK